MSVYTKNGKVKCAINGFRLIAALTLTAVLCGSVIAQEQSANQERQKLLKSLAETYQEEARKQGFEPKDIIQAVLDYSYNLKDQPQRDHEEFIRRKEERDRTFRSLCSGYRER